VPASPAARTGTAAPLAEGERLRASPRARRLASDRGIDLASVRGSGPGGRVLEQDLDTASVPRPATPAAAGERRVPLGKIRRTTAQRMAAAAREVPHFYASSEIDVEALVGVKDDLRGRGAEWQRVTVTHLLLKAVGLALRAVPEMNASWADDAVILHETVNIGLAVATDDGLLVPVVRGCDTEPLAELVRRAQGLVERVRSRRIAADDLLGATFTISNLGMYPVSQFAAVVNPPHAGILAVGAIRATPVVRGKQVVAGQMMAVTLSCDHRVVDGVIAGRFLEALKSRLEEPRTLLE
jgi:pyruvate dehydrogenase E2 component (dihydrolipoamide acetyltransferase)